MEKQKEQYEEGSSQDYEAIPLHSDWAQELQRRTAALEAGLVATVPWAIVRDEAIARLKRN